MNEEMREQRWTVTGGLDTDFKMFVMCHKGNFQSQAHLAFLLVLDFDFFQNMFCVCVLLSHVQLFVTQWAVSHQALLSKDSPGRNTGVRCHFLMKTN